MRSSGSDSNSKNAAKILTPAQLQQIAVLRSLDPKTKDANGSKVMSIPEITQAAGLPDEKDTQRFLFILEGNKLVSPFPAGDFTSKSWQITGDGREMLRVINSTPHQ